MTDPPGTISVDRKRNLEEVVKNVASKKDPIRFQKECVRAKRKGIRLIILVEHGGKIKSIEDVKGWINTKGLKRTPYAVSGKRLYKIMKTYEAKYGVRWEFCDKRVTGKRIVELLNGE